MSEASEKILEAIRSNDLIKAKHALVEGMKPVIASLLESEKQTIAASVMVEGEEPEDDDEGDDDKDEDNEE